MYWAPGAAHGPHHIFKEWAGKYKGNSMTAGMPIVSAYSRGKKQLGWVPPNTKLTPRADTMASWDSIPKSQRPFQRRLMEVFAGFVEHTDAQVGRLIDGMEQLGLRENTIIFYIFASSEESVGDVGLRQSAKRMIQRDFGDVEGAKAVGFSHGQFGFVVETLDHTAGHSAFWRGNSSGSVRGACVASWRSSSSARCGSA